jgi:hypothetical protein
LLPGLHYSVLFWDRDLLAAQLVFPNQAGAGSVAVAVLVYAYHVYTIQQSSRQRAALQEFLYALTLHVLLLRSVLESATAQTHKQQPVPKACHCKPAPFWCDTGLVIKALPGSGMSWCVTCVMFYATMRYMEPPERWYLVSVWNAGGQIVCVHVC